MTEAGARIGPIAEPVPCANCAEPVDPLRAARVAIFYDRFRYFCSAQCRDRYDPDAKRTPLPEPRHRRRTPGSLPAAGVVEKSVGEDQQRAAEALAIVGDEARVELSPKRAIDLAIDSDGPDRYAAPGDVVEPTDVGTLLLALAMLGGVLAVALLLTGDSSVALSSRVVVVVVATGALVTQYAMGQRDPTEPHPVTLLAAPVAGAALSLVARVMGHPMAGSAVTLTGLVVTAVAASVWLMQRARTPLEAEREAIAEALNAPGHRVLGDDVVAVNAADLRPGEEIVLGPGEVVPVDATVTAGSAEVLPWHEAKSRSTLEEGDPVVAGARVLEGRLRVVVGWAGYDRAWLRLTGDPRRRADLLAPGARVGRLVAERGAPLGAGLAALTAFAANQDLVGIGLYAVAAQAAIANAGIAQIGALHVGRAVLEALRRGIAFRTTEALDRTGRVSVATFCARGTLLLGEPEVASIEAFGPHEPEKVLALVAGAESGNAHPVASAVLRAARSRGVRPDGVRSPNVQPGLGVTAVASSGQALVVGSRALMLKERVSVAAAEAKITDLEAMGRTVMLVALGSRLVGVVGLQDGLRPGARAAVQHLLDVGVEPVLLSGDARETCEAIGRTLDIEHIRPEVLPVDRGEEIRRLADGGAVVAVIGQSPSDDVALSAGDVSVALSSAGSTASEWSVQLASDDVRDAAYAIRLAHRCRSEGRLGLILTISPAVAATLAVAFALAPPAIAPVAAVVGTLAALYRLGS